MRVYQRTFWQIQVDARSIHRTQRGSTSVQALNGSYFPYAFLLEVNVRLKVKGLKESFTDIDSAVQSHLLPEC